jgi:hypothetical protein
MKKAAVVIGVNKTGKLAPLESAAAGAKRVATWLEAEGFEVKCITDEAGPVDTNQIEKAVDTFVTLPPRYHLLVIYFSGHGYWQARSDQWLLSGAPVKSKEAVNLETAMYLAKYSGIPNVVFISDACRSIPDSRTGALVEGIGLFPNYDEIKTSSKIDYFKATSEALPAWEGSINGEPQSVLTAALRSAYEEPDEDMIRQVTEDGKTVEVVPNRRLEEYLQRKIDDLLAKIDPNLSQRIEAQVPSSDEVYIARVRRPTLKAAMPSGPDAGPLSPAPAPVPTAPVPKVSNPGREAAAAISRTLSTRRLFGGAGPDPLLITGDTVTERDVQMRLPDVTVDHFETQAGFVVHGAQVRFAVAAKGKKNSKSELRQIGDGQSLPGIVRLLAHDSGPLAEPLSVVLQVGDGVTSPSITPV